MLCTDHGCQEVLVYQLSNAFPKIGRQLRHQRPLRILRLRLLYETCDEWLEVGLANASFAKNALHGRVNLGADLVPMRLGPVHLEVAFDRLDHLVDQVAQTASCRLTCNAQRRYRLGFQFRRRVSGAADASSLPIFMRNRPSRATSYCWPCVAAVPPPQIRGWNNATGVPGSSAVPFIVIEAAISVPSGAMSVQLFAVMAPARRNPT